MKSSVVTGLVTTAMILVLSACSLGSSERPDAGATDNTEFNGASGEAAGQEQVREAPPSNEDELIQIAEMFNLGEPPEVVPVRTVTSEEREVLFAECMVDAGFPQRNDGGFWFEDPSQYEAFGLAVYECTARYPIDDRYLEPLTDAQLELIHQHTRTTMIPCYAEHDWPIAVEAFPSLETFIATWGTSDQWVPDAPPNEIEPEEIYQISIACPSTPPSDELYAHELTEGAESSTY